MTKTTDTNGDFKPPEESVRRRLTIKTQDPNNAYKKTGTTAIKVVPIKPAVQEVYIGEKPNLNERRKSVWARYNVNALNYAIEKLNIPKVITKKVKGEFVQIQVDKINKKTMLEMIYKKLNMLNSHKNIVKVHKF